jgi:catechol 2,3-dioxygenase-like lactoylglutathione lyase family enzyme
MKFHFYYAGIRVRDLKRSVEFYTKAMGMKVVNKGTMPHGGEVRPAQREGLEADARAQLVSDRQQVLLRVAPGEEMDHLEFVVKDVAKAYKELTSKGATSAVSPKESKGTEVYVKDPDGIDRASVVRLRLRSSRTPSRAAPALWRSSPLRPCVSRRRRPSRRFGPRGW